MASGVQFEGREEKAKATIDHISFGVESGLAPVINQIVEIIREISGKSDRMSVNDLAETISRDPTMMSRIVAIATTLGYNPCGIEIISIHQAISVIGFERIRTLAVAVLLMENAESAQTGEVLRELAGVGLAGGLFASEMCRQGMGVDPDLVFLCGVLRNYGQILLATFMPGEYAIAIGMGGYPIQEETFVTLFGLTPLDLGRELLGRMNLPAPILNSLRPPPPLEEDHSGNPVISLAELGLQLAETVSAGNITPESFASRVHRISAEFGEDIALSSESAKELTSDVAARLHTFCGGSDLSRNSVKLFRRLQGLASGGSLPPPFEPLRKAAKAAGEAQPAIDPGALQAVSTASRSAGLLDVAAESLARLVRKTPPDPRRVFELLLKVLREALRLQSCLLFLRDRTGTRFYLSQGDGPLLKEIQGTVSLDVANKDVFNVPLVRGEDVFIENPNDERIIRFIPEWLRRPGKTRPFILLPIKDTKGTFALVCGTSTDANAFAVVEQVIVNLRRIRTEVALLGPHLRQMQPGPAKPDAS